MRPAGGAVKGAPAGAPVVVCAAYGDVRETEERAREGPFNALIPPPRERLRGPDDAADPQHEVPTYVALMTVAVPRPPSKLSRTARSRASALNPGRLSGTRSAEGGAVWPSSSAHNGHAARQKVLYGIVRQNLASFLACSCST
jgi:hypothetical protein